MNPRRNRWLLRLAVVLLVGLIALFWAVSERTRSLTIENRSEQSIPVLNITIAGQTKTFQNVKAGDEVTVPCSARGDDRFTVDGQLADGTRIRANGPIGDSPHFLLLPGGQLELRRKGSS
jgi:hypothetical protein